MAKNPYYKKINKKANLAAFLVKYRLFPSIPGRDLSKGSRKKTV